MSRIDNILVAPSTERKTAPSGFGEVLRGALHGATEAVGLSLALAAPFVPGGAVLAGALVGGARAAAAVSSAGRSRAPGGADGGGDLLEATRALQREGQLFNAQYLQIQESMQRESRAFTALSNVMKVKHDAAKAAINNIH